MKKYLLFCLSAMSISTLLFSQNSFPSISIETYGETAHLIQSNSSPLSSADTLEHNYMIVITADAPDSISAMENITSISVKVGSSVDSTDFFSGIFSPQNLGNVPDGGYYGVSGNKHFIKVYLTGITQASVKNYAIQLTNKEGILSSVYTGTISQ